MFYQWAYDLGFYYTNTYTHVNDWIPCVQWFERHWWFFTLSAILYLPAVFLGTQFMKNRAPYNVDVHLKIWNLLMCVFSLAGAIYTIPVSAFAWYHYGWHGFVCGADQWPYEVGIAGEFIVVFIVSKALEFVDTLLLIVRKKPIIFLHYYHHVITFLFTWYQGMFEFHFNGMGYFFSAMNYLVHFIMYGYYFMHSCGYRMSFLAKPLTTLQIIQMFFGLAAVITSMTCEYVDWFNSAFGLVLYGSFMFLFCRFFVMRYLMSPTRSAAPAKNKKTD